MLCPFHYYGVTEYLGSQTDGNNTDSKTIQVSPVMSTDDSQQVKYEISQLATPERVRYIIDVLRQYSPYHQQITGLVFCSRTDEAQHLSDLFNSQLNQQAERNYRTKALSGSTPHKEREKTIKELEHGDLDYIFTVDLFNEGIDIPAINQIVMLRNTQSSIVFTQQLGRGLRKFPHKESVTVIDFIGNYANNYLIPVALYGNTGDRDITRKNLQRHSIGLSSISFDPIAKERVLKSLDTADWSDMRKLTEQYRQLKFELGCTPMLADLYQHDYSLPYTIASKCGNYYDFVRSRERSLGQKNHNTETSASLSSYDNLPELSDNQSGILKLATEVLLPGLRPHELVMLSLLCKFADAQMNPRDVDAIRSNDWRDAGSISLDCLSETVSRVFPERICKTDTDHQQFESALHVLDYSYFTSTNVKRFGNVPLIDVENGRAHLTQAFTDILRHDPTFRIFLQDTLRVGLLNCRDISNAARKSQRTFEHAFLYGQKYTLADVMRLLCWNKESNGQNVGGYSVDYVTNTMPVFVKYATSQYEDQFLNQHDMKWFSKNGRTPNSPEFQWMGNGLDNDTWQDNHFIPLFVMRKEESKEARYYYVGHIIGFDQPKLRTKSDANNTKIVKVTSSILHLNKPLDAEMYRHLTGIMTI